MSYTTVIIKKRLARRIRKVKGNFVSVSRFVSDAVVEKLEREAAAKSTTTASEVVPGANQEDSAT